MYDKIVFSLICLLGCSRRGNIQALRTRCVLGQRPDSEFSPAGQAQARPSYMQYEPVRQSRSNVGILRYRGDCWTRSVEQAWGPGGRPTNGSFLLLYNFTCKERQVQVSISCYSSSGKVPDHSHGLEWSKWSSLLHKWRKIPLAVHVCDIVLNCGMRCPEIR